MEAKSEGILDYLAYEIAYEKNWNSSLQSYLSLSLNSGAQPSHLLLIQSLK
jgi:hypothetical protein